MVWLEDPLTGDMPHRGIVEEEDEKQAAELAPQYAVAPTVQWAPGQAPVEGATLVSADADSCVGALESVCWHCTADVCPARKAQERLFPWRSACPVSYAA